MVMAVNTRYKIKNAEGVYEVIHFETSADQIITSDDKQFISAEEKRQLSKPQYYTHNQVASTEEWDISHNLNKFPSVSIVDSAGSLVMGDIVYINENRLKIKFTSAFSGKAYLN